MRPVTLRGHRGLIHRLPAVIWLVLVWVMLWGTWAWANVVTGLLVAIGLMTLLPLPPVVLGGRLNPVGLARFVGRFVRDLVVSSVHVAWRAVAPGPEPRSAVVAVRLRSRSDLLLTMTAEALTLVPGSLVLDVDRTTGMLYAHVFDVHGPEGVERFRATTLELEARVIRAIGSPAAVRRLDEETRVPETAGELS
jgi:multicomponent Na+:H+ antiporter subunit E